MISDEQWKDEATMVIEGWERCFEALPESVKRRNLGRYKFDVVLDYIERINDPARQ